MQKEIELNSTVTLYELKCWAKTMFCLKKCNIIVRSDPFKPKAKQYPWQLVINLYNLDSPPYTNKIEVKGQPTTTFYHPNSLRLLPKPTKKIKIETSSCFCQNPILCHLYSHNHNNLVQQVMEVESKDDEKGVEKFEIEAVGEEGFEIKVLDAKDEKKVESVANCVQRDHQEFHKGGIPFPWDLRQITNDDEIGPFVTESTSCFADSHEIERFWVQDNGKNTDERETNVRIIECICANGNVALFQHLVKNKLILEAYAVTFFSLSLFFNANSEFIERVWKECFSRLIRADLFQFLAEAMKTGEVHLVEWIWKFCCWQNQHNPIIDAKKKTFKLQSPSIIYDALNYACQHNYADVVQWWHDRFIISQFADSFGHFAMHNFERSVEIACEKNYYLTIKILTTGYIDKLSDECIETCLKNAFSVNGVECLDIFLREEKKRNLTWFKDVYLVNRLESILPVISHEMVLLLDSYFPLPKKFLLTLFFNKLEFSEFQDFAFSLFQMIAFNAQNPPFELRNELSTCPPPLLSEKKDDLSEKNDEKEPPPLEDVIEKNIELPPLEYCDDEDDEDELPLLEYCEPLSFEHEDELPPLEYCEPLLFDKFSNNLEQVPFLYLLEKMGFRCSLNFITNTLSKRIEYEKKTAAQKTILSRNLPLVADIVDIVMCYYCGSNGNNVVLFKSQYDTCVQYFEHRKYFRVTLL